MVRILFATKFSESCEKALAYVAALVSESRVKIDLLHVFDLPILASQSLPIYAIDDSMEVHHKELSSRLTEILEKLPAQNQGTSEAIFGSSPAHEIAKYAQEGGYMLVAMAMQKHRSLSQKLLGTTTLHTINQSEVAVLAIPDGATFERIHKIILPTLMTYSADLTQEDEKVLRWLSDFSSVFQFPKIHMIHVNPMKSNNKPKITFKNKPLDGIEFSRDYAHTIEGGIIDFCNQEQAEMLALYKPHRPYWERLFHSSLTRKLLAKSPVPLLVFH